MLPSQHYALLASSGHVAVIDDRLLYAFERLPARTQESFLGASGRSKAAATSRQ